MVRNIQELGPNLQKIVTRLMENDNLIKYLYYTNQDPLSGANLTKEEKSKVVFEKLIKVVPRIGPKDLDNSLLSIRVVGADVATNTEFLVVRIAIESFVPLTQWIIKGNNLRPFAIMSEVDKSLNGKTINGLGKLTNDGFDLNFMTENISAYVQPFSITSYN